MSGIPCPASATPDGVSLPLTLKPRLQVLRGYRRPLLLRLENLAGPAVEHHVDRPTQMGARVLINDGWYYTRSETENGRVNSTAEPG
jgi:hypothetical protein